MKVVIVGPTGVGKTKMSVEIAKFLNAPVINSDAVQIYQELNIGSAKVTREEMDGVKHYLFDIRKPNEEYSVKDYQEDLRNLLTRFSNQNVVIAGGTGLYVCAGLLDYRFRELEDIDFSRFSNEELYEMVLKKDPDSKIDFHNRIRMERFLQKKDIENIEPKLLYDDVVFIGLTTPRDNLYRIINKRTDEMFQKGLVEEVKGLYEKYPDAKILKRAIGYKEVIEYLKGNISLEEVKELIKKNSRHYAKRQYTWFNNKLNVQWFDVDYDDFGKTIELVKKYIMDCHK